MYITPHAMRKYQIIWDKVKAAGRAEVVAPASIHSRIVYAVRKEKTKDAGWALLQSEEGKKWVMYNEAEGNKLSFWLEEQVPLIDKL